MVRSRGLPARATIATCSIPTSLQGACCACSSSMPTTASARASAGLLAIGDRVQVVGTAGGAATALALVIERVARRRRSSIPVFPRCPAGSPSSGDLRSIAPDVRIVAMSWSDSLEHAALTGGADGFVRKTFRPTELVAAIVAAGRRPAA